MVATGNHLRHKSASNTVERIMKLGLEQVSVLNPLKEEEHIQAEEKNC